MRRKLNTAVVLLMLALMPLRALATVTAGFCALHQQGSAMLDSAHGHHNHDGPAQQEESHDQCDSCVEHCASASVVAPSQLPHPAPASAHRIASRERFTAGFVPEPLDPPPLAL
jgi:hypothetical protein